MNEVKVWCEKCLGNGTFDYGLGYPVLKCDACDGKGYRIYRALTVDSEQPYTITDAQADAAVLTAITDYAATEIKKAILNRLHAFYVGGQDDKR